MGSPTVTRREASPPVARYVRVSSMAYRKPFGIGEFYHCYNRGVDKRRIFQQKKDYERFLSLLYICNGTKSVQISDRNDTSLYSILMNNSIDRGKSLTNIVAYALMPNHIHFVLKETDEKGIASFMQKVFTGYTMYFNRRYQRTGTLFAGPFKSRHIFDDRYLKQALPYVMLNPIELFEPKWKTGVRNIAACERWLPTYAYSSLPDFLKQKRPEGKLLGTVPESLYDSKPSLHKMLTTAQEYYRERGGETL